MNFAMSRRHLDTLLVALAVVAALMSGTEPVRAQIYEWTDNQNARHYANSLEGIPADERGDAKVVVGASTRPSSDTSVVVREEQVVTERPAREPDVEEEARLESSAARWQAGYDAGWLAAQRAAAAEQPVCPAEPAVVVVDSRPPVNVNVPRNDPSGAYSRPPAVNNVEGPFDDGAALGMTYRERVQDLRALERGW